MNMLIAVINGKMQKFSKGIEDRKIRLTNLIFLAYLNTTSNNDRTHILFQVYLEHLFLFIFIYLFF